MKRSLMEILACPICKHHPLELKVFEEKAEIVSGVLFCKNCCRWYPIIDEIPHMLPDELRSKDEEVSFLSKWRRRMPQKILRQGRPFTL